MEGRPDEQRFRPVPRKVVYEKVEGEVILIQLDRGTYFSLAGSGEPVWELLAVGASAESIGGALGRGPEERQSITASTAALIERLVSEELLEPVPADEAGGPGAAPDVTLDGDWIEPKLERYDDMKDFLALDPIHEVAEAGWPAKKPDS